MKLGKDQNIVYPMPTESFLCASSIGPIPDTMMMAESGTAPSRGRIIPPERHNKVVGFKTVQKLIKYFINTF